MAKIQNVTTNPVIKYSEIKLPEYDRERLEDVAFVTAMTLVMMGNYSQTGHFGGPLAYTPYTVATHLAGPELGGLKYDYRRPKHPYSDKFLLAGGHNAPATYALWMVLGEALNKEYNKTNSEIYYADPNQTLLSIDSLGFRRGKDALETLLQSHGLDDHPAFKQAKIRGIRALSGHSESTDLTNDVNGGPSGVGIATAAGKAVFWEMLGASESPKIIGIEGEFAMTAGHAQEMKTQAVAQQVGKRLRILLSYNNAGIDDTLVGGIVPEKFDSYRISDQWNSYGWNVFTIDNANEIDQVVSVLKSMEDWPEDDRRPMIVIGNTTKGWWPGAKNGQIPDYGDQIVSYASHPYTFSMNSDYFIALAKTFEEKFSVKFKNLSNGPVTDEKERLIQYKENIDIVMSVLDKNGLGNWISDRLVNIGDQVLEDINLKINPNSDPFQDSRLLPSNIPLDPVKVNVSNQMTGESKEVDIKLFEKPGVKAGSRRAISESVKWINYVTENRLMLLAADLADSINIEKGSLWGHYDPVTNPSGNRLRSAIQEAGNASTAIGLISQSASIDPNIHSGVWAISGTYGAFTPLMYLPARIWSQQNQDSPFRVGVLNILAGHSGPETAADARTHFGIFSPQVWKLFPKNQIINLSFWDYNDVAPGYMAAIEIAAKDPKVGIITIEVARPDFPVVDRNTLADSDILAAQKGFYVIKDFDNKAPKQGYIIVQGSSSTNGVIAILNKIISAKLNVKIISAISEELFNRQSDDYKNSVLPSSAYYDMMIISTGTKRMWPISNVGPLTEKYSLISDWNDQWLSGGTESEVIKEANLDKETIFESIKRFALDHKKRIETQKSYLDS